jgi:hypothetical protein
MCVSPPHQTAADPTEQISGDDRFGRAFQPRQSERVCG